MIITDLTPVKAGKENTNEVLIFVAKAKISATSLNKVPN